MHSQFSGPRGRGRLSRVFTLASLAAVSLLAGCSDGIDKPKSPPVVTPPTPPPPGVIFAPSTGPVATIRRTTGGVPHIQAADLQSAAFAMGYAQAQDNVCILADAFLKARGERSRFLGPGPNNAHVIGDFSLRAQHIRSGALADLATMDNPSRAMIFGFTQGYNKYVRETSPASYPAECRNQPWVFQIEPEDYRRPPAPPVPGCERGALRDRRDLCGRAAWRESRSDTGRLGQRGSRLVEGADERHRDVRA